MGPDGTPLRACTTERSRSPRPGTCFCHGQLVNLTDVEGPYELRYDAEWLAILNRTDVLAHEQRQRRPVPFEQLYTASLPWDEDVRTPLTVRPTAPGRGWSHVQVVLAAGSDVGGVLCVAKLARAAGHAHDRARL